MATYTLKEFAEKVNYSQKTIARYIEKGKTPHGKKWAKPPKVNGKYVLTESDVNQWTKGVMRQDNLSKRASGREYNALFEKYEQSQEALQELRILSSNAKTAIEKDLESASEKFTESQTRNKDLVQKLEQSRETTQDDKIKIALLERELQELRGLKKRVENSSAWQRFFNKFW